MNPPITKPILEVKKVGDAITVECMSELYTSDCAATFNSLDKYLPWWRDLDAPRAAVIFDLSFNMGVGNDKKGLRSFKKMLAACVSKDFAKAAYELLSSKYAKDVGNRALVNAKQLGVGTWQY